MKTLYCIPGLGADETIFQYLDLSFINPVYANWLPPFKNETLQSYAMRMKEEYIRDAAPLILGLSLGGMVASEIAKAIPSAKVIIISSAKTKHEIPFYWRFFKYLPIYKILPEPIVKHASLLRNYFLGAKTIQTKSYIKKVVGKSEIHFYRWAMGAIINWQNKIASSNIIHIHGMNDKLLPYNFVKPDISINNGEHLMIIERSEEISRILREIISV